MGQTNQSVDRKHGKKAASSRQKARALLHDGAWRSLLLYWVGGSCRGETTGLAGSGRWKGKGWKGKCEFPNTAALVHTLAIIELRQTVFWPHPFFPTKKVLSIKNLYGKPGLFWSTDLLLPKKGVLKQQSRVVCCELLGGLAAIKSDHPSSRRVAHVSEVLDSPKTKAPCSWKVP